MESLWVTLHTNRPCSLECVDLHEGSLCRANQFRADGLRHHHWVASLAAAVRTEYNLCSRGGHTLTYLSHNATNVFGKAPGASHQQVIVGMIEIDFLHKTFAQLILRSLKCGIVYTHTHTYLCKVQCVVAFYGHKLLSAACWCRVRCRGVELTKHRLSRVEVLVSSPKLLFFLRSPCCFLSASGLMCVAVLRSPPVKGKFLPSAVRGDKSKQTQK